MRVVVTGATGNVGTSVVEALAADSTVDEIVGLARRLPSWKPDKTTFVAADVRSTDAGSQLRGADVVVHLAWAFQPTHGPLTTWDVNVLGGINVFEAAAAADVARHRVGVVGRCLLAGCRATRRRNLADAQHADRRVRPGEGLP